MPLSPITPINIAGGSTMSDVETAINSLIDQRIVSGAFDGQSLTLTTYDGSTVVIPMMRAVDGIVSGLAATRSGALNYSIAIGSYNCMGDVRVVAAPVALVCAARDAADDRYDLIVGDDTGALSVITGVPNAGYPTIAANEVILYVVGIPQAGKTGLDSVVAQYAVNTETKTAIQTDPRGMLVLSKPIKPEVQSFAIAGNVDLDKQVIAVDSSGAGFILTVPDALDSDQYQGVEYVFYDLGAAGGNNWTIEDSGGVIATANVNNQVIRLRIVSGVWRVG